MNCSPYKANNSSDSNVPSVELANSKEPSAAAVFDISSNESSPLASCGCCSTVNSDLKNLENQFNDFRNLILSKLNMQVGLSHDERVQPKREADVQLINTLRQKNEDLNNEISILKELLREKEAKRGKFPRSVILIKLLSKYSPKNLTRQNLTVRVQPMINRMIVLSNQVKIMHQTAKQRRPNRVKAKNLTAKRPRLGRKFNKHQSISQTVSLRLVTRIRIPIKMPVPLITQTSQLCLLATQ